MEIIKLNNRLSSLIELKNGLLNNYDYVVLPKKIYKHLKLWYSVDYEIKRYFKKDITNKNNFFFDLYPG